MKILLLGDYSNVHATLATALSKLGHEVTLASDGDGWKDYPRDIDLKRPSLGRMASLCYMIRLERIMRKFRDFDVVQLIGPVFLPLKAERIYRYYHMLRRHNKRVFMGAFGMDRYYVEACLNCKTFRYSDFNMGTELRRNTENDQFIADWKVGEKGRLNQFIAQDCDGIIAGLYEYYASYFPAFPRKLRFIPFPIVPRSQPPRPAEPQSLRVFIGIMRGRSAYKGTDIMLRALLRAKEKYGDRLHIERVENVPFAQYTKLLSGSDVLLDQLYSYTPAMNALEAMAQGLIVIGGAEPENYDILHENTLRPIINVQPNEESVYQAISRLVENPQLIPILKQQSQAYIMRHHDHLKVARQYLGFWASAQL